jgi:hypothetical protein
MEDLVDVVPFVVLLLLFSLGTAFFRRRDRRRGVVAGRRSVRERVRTLVIVIGVLVISPTIGIGIGTALSLSAAANARLGVFAELAALMGAMLWRKLRLERG